MFMYKLNLLNLKENNWHGSKICLKKNLKLKSPQWLRELKFKKYPFWRIDKNNLQIIDGGWHFSFLQSPEDIIKKITKITPVFSTTGGTSDARFIRKISPCLEFGLVNKTMHKIDECVSLKDLKNLTKIYQNILEDYFK